MSTKQAAPEKPKRRARTPEKPYYRALKPLQIGKKRYRRRQIVPEAKTWPRVEAWVRSRHLELVE